MTDANMNVTCLVDTGGDAVERYVYDPYGNVTVYNSDWSATYTSTYDAWNRLVEVKDGDDVIARYEYDGLGRRVKKHIDSSAPASPDGTIDTWCHFFYNSGWQVLETRKATSENTAPDSLQPEYQYVWSLRYIDAPVLRDENTDEDDLCDDETLYYLNDANMNVTCLTDTGGDAVERYVYDPYGNCTVYNSDWSATVAWADSKKNNIRYCGYRFDPETGLYHVRNRMYHPTLGCWMQRDPSEYVDGLNLYGYLDGMVLGLTDPYGLGRFDCCDECKPEHKKQKVSPREHKLRYVGRAVAPGPVDDLAEVIYGFLGLVPYDPRDAAGYGRWIKRAGRTSLKGAEEAMRKARAKGGVNIWVRVEGECCEQQRCWLFFWKYYLDWEEREYWHECSAHGKNRAVLGGFSVDDTEGIAIAIFRCFGDAKRAFDCRKAKRK